MQAWRYRYRCRALSSGAGAGVANYRARETLLIVPPFHARTRTPRSPLLLPRPSGCIPLFLFAIFRKGARAGVPSPVAVDTRNARRIVSRSSPPPPPPPALRRGAVPARAYIYAALLSR